MFPHRQTLLHRPFQPSPLHPPSHPPLAASTLTCDPSSPENMEAPSLPPPLPTLLDYFPEILSDTNLAPSTSASILPNHLTPSFPPLPRPRVISSSVSEKQSMQLGKQSSILDPPSMPPITASTPSPTPAAVSSSVQPALGRTSVFQRLHTSPAPPHPPLSTAHLLRPSYASKLQPIPSASTSTANPLTSLIPMPDFSPIPPEIRGTTENPQLLFQASDVHKAQSLFNLALVARFNGSRPPVDVFARHVNQEWGLTNPAVVGLLNPKHILLRFSSSEDLAIAWAQSGFLPPHFHFLLFKWNANYATKIGPQHRAQWVQFPHLPLHFQTPSILQILGNTIGKFLKADPRTAVGKHPISPRILVEIDTARPCPKQLHLGWTENGRHAGFDQSIVWETSSTFCQQCKRYGHHLKTCSRSQHVSAPPPLSTVHLTSPPIRQVTASTTPQTVSPTPSEPAEGRTLPSPKNLKTGTQTAPQAHSSAPPITEPNWVQFRPKPLSSVVTISQKSRSILTPPVIHRDSFISLSSSLVPTGSRQNTTTPPSSAANTLAAPSSASSPSTSMPPCQRLSPPASHLHIGRSPPHTTPIIQPPTSHTHPSTSYNSHPTPLASPPHQPQDPNPFSILATLKSQPTTFTDSFSHPPAMEPLNSSPPFHGPVTEDSDSDFELDMEELHILSNASPPLSPSQPTGLMATSNTIAPDPDPFNLMPLILATPISSPSPKPVCPHPTIPPSSVSINSSPVPSPPSSPPPPFPLPQTIAELGPCHLNQQHMQLSSSPSHCTTTSTQTWPTSPSAPSFPARLPSSPNSASLHSNSSQNQQDCPSAQSMPRHPHFPHSATPTSTSAQPPTLHSSPLHSQSISPSPSSTSASHAPSSEHSEYLPPNSIPPSSSLVDSAKSKPSRKNKKQKTPKSLPPPSVPPYRSTRSSKNNKTPFH